MKIGLVADKYKDPDFSLLNYVTEYLEKNNVEVYYPDIRDKYRDVVLAKEFSQWENLDLVISIGGDGTFLYACHKVYPLDIPIIGINLGHMGFMTEIEEENLDEALDMLSRKEYVIKQRMMLDVQVFDGEHNVLYQDFALNDAVLYRGSISQIIPCTFSIDGNIIETIPSDGLIVAAPTGSTGYALSCGGPIIDPNLEMILVTPISPHTLHNRSYVLGADSVIEVGIREHYPHRPLFSIDGRSNIEVDSSVRVEVRRAAKDIKILSVENINFFHRVPDKLNARGTFHGNGQERKTR